MKRKWIICCGVLLALMFLTSCRKNGILIVDPMAGVSEEQNETEGANADEAETASTQTGMIIVHLCGEVLYPGVYELEQGSRVYQLIEMAGGFLDGAAEGYLNLAGVLCDGQKVVVPAKDEVAGDRYGTGAEDFAADAEDADDRVNINTADKEKLMTLPGIGEAKALAIIAWRTEHGRFECTEEIMKVSGIKEAAYEKIKTLITVD